VEVGASYDTPPNEVKRVISAALRDEPLLAPDRETEVLIADFAASAVTYRVRVWTTDFAADMRVRDRVRSHIYYAFRRHKISIPYPIQVQIEQAAGEASVGAVERARLIDGVAIFASLTPEQRAELVAGSRHVLFEAGQTIVSQGDRGASMFVLCAGEAAVTLAGADGELARHHAGGFFGEMSLLTGDPRSATVTAVTDCDLIEIGVDAFRDVVMADATLVERVSEDVARRRAALDQHRAHQVESGAAPETPQTLVARIRRFLRL
jgi:CRP-like cAMP-binding protein